jgi:UDP-N-acetylglucosamine/UDP-N-acetylgalactosamine diphosphorylase
MSVVKMMATAPQPNANIDARSSDKQHLLGLLKPWGQEHLLAFWDKLLPAERSELAEQIRGVDFDLVARLYRDATAGHDRSAEDPAVLARRAEPPPAIRLRDPNSKFASHEAIRRGEAALRAGKLGVVLVAGGQGTRLGFDHPKGLYPIGPVSGATLFQILFEKLIAGRCQRWRSTIALGSRRTTCGCSARGRCPRLTQRPADCCWKRRAAWR